MPVQKDIGECCLCFPLKIGMIMLSILTFVHGMICVAAIFTGDLRLQPGGYAPYTNGLQVRLGSFGILFGPMCILGVIDSKLHLVKQFNWFQYTKLTVAAVVFLADLYMLQFSCEKSTWSKSLESPVYNAALDTLAIKHICRWTRDAYIIGFLMDFCLQAYFTWVGSAYHTRMSYLPGVMIQFPGQDAKFPENHTGLHFFNPEIGEVAAEGLAPTEPMQLDPSQKDKIIRENYGSLPSS